METLKTLKTLAMISGHACKATKMPAMFVDGRYVRGREAVKLSTSARELATALGVQGLVPLKKGPHWVIRAQGGVYFGIVNLPGDCCAVCILPDNATEIED